MHQLRSKLESIIFEWFPHVTIGRPWSCFGPNRCHQSGTTWGSPTADRKHGRTRLVRSVLLLGLFLCACLTGCATVGSPRGESLVPTRYIARTGPYEVATNFPLATTDPVMNGLKSLGQEVEASLGISVDAGENPVKVYILSDRAAFIHFLTIYYPELPQRRAFFLAQGSQRVVYTYRGDHLAIDLRHEATHALLNLAVGDLPIWLDEGLGEYFEVPPESRGLNNEHYQKLVQEREQGWRPDLSRLEQMATVRDLAPRDYRESWLWVHSLLNGSPASRAALMDYLADRRKTGGKSTPLSEYLAGDRLDNADRLLVHLDSATTRSLAALSPARETTVRLQSSTLEIPRPARPKRGFLAGFKRIFFGQDGE